MQNSNTCIKNIFKKFQGAYYENIYMDLKNVLHENEQQLVTFSHKFCPVPLFMFINFTWVVLKLLLKEKF